MKWTVLQGAIGLMGTLATSLEAQAYDPAPGVAIDFAALREETAQRLSEYLRINTTNLPGNELAAARWLQQTLAREGIEGQILDTLLHHQGAPARPGSVRDPEPEHG